MRSLLPSLAVALISTGCADAALHAANGTPKQWAPLSVATAEQAWRTPDGSLGVCVTMWLGGGAWSRSDSDTPGAYSAVIPSPIAPEVELPYTAWRRHVHASAEGGRNSGNCAEQVPEGACLLRLDLVTRGRVGVVPLGEQELRVSDAARVITTLELQGEDRSGNPLFWPLVPLGYIGDVAIVVAAIPLAVVVIVIALPPAMIYTLVAEDAVPTVRPQPSTYRPWCDELSP